MINLVISAMMKVHISVDLALNKILEFLMKLIKAASVITIYMNKIRIRILGAFKRNKQAHR